jgi:hypothetical protein
LVDVLAPISHHWFEVFCNYILIENAVPSNKSACWTILRSGTALNWGGAKMIRNPRIRRVGAIGLVALGAVLMFLAPEVWQGALLLALGIALEVVGITLERKAEPD